MSYGVKPARPQIGAIPAGQPKGKANFQCPDLPGSASQAGLELRAILRGSPERAPGIERGCVCRRERAGTEAAQDLIPEKKR